MAATKRPTTCSMMAAVDPTLGEAGCKRLPRHGGEHRAFRTLAEGRRAERAAANPVKASPKGRTGRRQSVAAVADLVATLRTNAGAIGRKAMTAAQRRIAFSSLTEMVESGKLSASAALHVAAKLR